MTTRGYKRYVLGALTVIYTWSIVDQGMITLFLEPIKQDLRMSDTQLGMLAGVAFGLTYSAFGVPIARWSDRRDRSVIAALMIALWGATIMLSSAAKNFGQLIAARAITAIGEAGCMPPTYSLLGDYFPEASERNWSMTIYMLANPLSFLLSFVVGGQLNEHFGWRFVFFVAGVTALVLAPLVKLTIREPRLKSLAMQDSSSSSALMPVLRLLWKQQSTRRLTLALMLAYTVGLALAPWDGAFMIRNHGAAVAELGTWFGLIFGLGGVTGVLLGGYVTERWFATDERHQLRAIGVAVGLLTPCMALFLLLPGKVEALTALVPFVLAANFLFGPTFALLQRLVPDDMRATAAAVVLLVCNLVGMGLGPQVVGSLSDALRPLLGENSLRYSMLAMAFLALWSGALFWRAGRTVAADLATAAA
jgi:MFS family permease